MKLKTIYLLIWFAFFIVGALSNENREYWRIANNSIPLIYDVHINTTLEDGDFQFNGTVIIKLKFDNISNMIQFHGQNLDIKETILESPRGDKVATTLESSKILGNQIYSLKLNENEHMENGNYSLTIKYNGFLREDNLGYYRSNYTNDKGETIWLAATQFAPTYARSAFPCMDEPNKKSFFNIKLTHPRNKFAISNMPEISVITNEDKTLTTSFETSPLLPTYLIGFIVSDFGSSNLIKKNFTQQYYTRPNAINVIQFSEEYGANVLQYFMDLFTTAPLPLQTIKQVPLPNFHFSGMENFGMVTYRESRLFFDPKLHGAKQLLGILDLMGHEMAHNWFGNLVTMVWWTYVWMKEGFSTMYSYKAANQLKPEWDMMEKFQSGVLQYVMQIDADKSIRPMTHYVETIDEIKKNYDRIAYEKSACVLRMIDNAIGEKEFKKSIDLYLEKMSYKNVEEDDFFNSLEESLRFHGDTSVNIRQVMKSWTNQRGYPIVSVRVNHESGSIELQQQRFVDKFQDDEDNPIYFIPINYISSKTNNPKNHTAFLWLTNTSQTYPLPSNFSSQDWIVLNFEQTGYYRVKYDENTYENLINLLRKNHSALPTLNRAQIVDDLFSSLDNGYKKNYTQVLRMLEYFANEYQYSPWNAFDLNVKQLYNRLQHRKSFQRFKDAMKQIISEPFEKIKDLSQWESLTPTQKLTRETIMRWYCKLDPDQCQKVNITNSHVDLRSLRYCLELAKGSSETIDNIFKSLESNITEPTFRADIFLSFGCTTNKDLMNQILTNIFNVNATKSLDQNERKFVQQSIYQQSSLGVDTTLGFWNDHTELVLEVMEEEKMNELIVDISKYCFKDDQQERLLYSFKSSPKKTTLELIIEANKKWLNMHGDSIDTYYSSTLRLNLDSKIFLILVFFVSISSVCHL